MNTLHRIPFVTSVLGSLLAISAQAATLSNSFNVPFDYVANGIVGDTNWDGVYMRFGDIPGGTAGGNGNGNTLQANTTTFGGGFFGVQSVGGGWTAAEDDGFFIYKVVRGDFDASVDNLPATFTGGTAYDNRANNFSGLMVRAYNTNNSGGPFSTTLTNAAENFVLLWRFNQFGIDGQVRVSTNGANQEYTYLHPAVTNANSDINNVRGFRITRSGNKLSFFVRRYDYGAAPEPWLQVTNFSLSTNMTRGDWEGVALQVGIAHAPFATASRDAFFDDFVLTGTNVTFPAMPTAPANLVTTATNVGGSLTLSWTKGSPANSSLVVVSRQPIQHNPVQGVTYNANAAYGTGSAGLSGTEYVVYNGTGNSVTVTNLGANNLTYYAAVFEYSGSGGSTVYNTANPATNAFAGPGVISGVTIEMSSSNIPAGGAAKARLLANFSTGETGSDQTANSTWSTGDPGIATIDAAGSLSGVAAGSTTVSAAFGTFTPSVNITVSGPPAFSDTFAAAHNYVASGLLGTPYDGLYLNLGDVPGATAGTDGSGSTLTLDSQITSTNGLYVSSVQSTWNDTFNDGPFLFKVVPGSSASTSGDFQAAVHIQSMNTLNGVVVGLMARLYNSTNGGPAPGGLEHHVEYWKVQNGATSVRRTQNQSGNNTTTLAGGNAANGWLLIQRANSTNFYFYEKATLDAPWTFLTSTVLAAAANNAPMQVGIAQQSTAGVNAISVFDNFWLSAAGLVGSTAPPTPAGNFSMTLNQNLTMTINYTVGKNTDGTAIGSIVVMRDGGPVTAQPWMGVGLTGNSVFGTASQNLGGANYVVYRSPDGTTETNQSVTVSGLIPGHTYYAAVYTFVGSGANRLFNNNASAANSSLQDGLLLGINAVPVPSIPLGGIGQVQVLGNYTGGAQLDVTALATITSADTNIVKILNGILTGVSAGTTNLTLVYGGFTNLASVTVRPASFSDNFNVDHDYLTSGVTGTAWDGVYRQHFDALTGLSINEIPGSPYTPASGAGTTNANANISSNGVLTVTASGDGWENANAGGFFLYKYAAGDFQVAVRVRDYDVQAFNQPGLLARAYGVATNGAVGAPFGTIWPVNGTNNLGEYWVSFCRFDEFNIGTYARRNLNNAVSQNTQPDSNDGGYRWLLIVRSKGTEFDFYKRLNETDPWVQVPNKTHYSLAQFAGQPMQVGIMAGAWSGPGVARTARFEKFMLDLASGPTLRASIVGTDVLVIWPDVPGFALQSSPSLDPGSADWQPAGGTVNTSNGQKTVTLPLGAANRFFRLVQ